MHGIDIVELELQQELRSMFDVDTQTYLQSYMRLVQQLHSQSWSADIQEMYRLIHTIKGGAVTVGVDAILYASTVLEDLLSDLRYLNPAPSLEDGQFGQLLMEAGELLASSLQVQAVGNDAIAAIQPTVQRLQALRSHIQQVYLPEWSEQNQLYQEFAEQGFDLVVLDLEMALEKLPERGTVPTEVVNTAKQTLIQLIEIGKDLQFDSEWKKLLRRSKAFFTSQKPEIWRSKWPVYLSDLKACARLGGKLAPPEPVAEQPTALSLVEPSVADGHDTTNESGVQIPVPLSRLDQTAEHLVEALLAARSSQGLYNNLQSQLVKLFALAQESAQYITRLRQIQDDYALLDSMKSSANSSSEGLTLERYNQGYTTINRLLETSLRLSELGAEAEKTVVQTADSMQSLDRNILKLRQTVEDSRLVPFKNLSFRARAILRDLTNRYGKPAQLVVQGEQIELDVGTVSKLEPALLHLLRNAYDHGIEQHSRVALGKPEQGKITLSLQRRGNTFEFSLQDDGRGIDAKAIQKIAQAKGLPFTRTQTPTELLAVLCQPGFSSQSTVSELSGRGVGMDVVANQVTSLRGRLSLNTVPGAGTTFHLQIPVPHLLVSCVLLKAGDRTFAIPAEDIITTNLLGNLNATQTTDPSYVYSWMIQEAAGVVPGLDFLEYWQARSILRPLSDTAVCVYIRSLEQKGAWLIADELLGQTDLLVSPLPSPLVAPIGLMGVSLQNDGTFIPVIEVETLAEYLLASLTVAPVEVTVRAPVADQTHIPVHLCRLEPGTEDGAINQNILVVDDAALMRRRIEASLTAYGYTTHSCADGLEAWNWLQTHPNPSLMITDIEMPGMDGLTLIDHCRQAGITIPILVISSRLSEDWGKEARRLGATDYLTKGFSTTELISKLNTLRSG